MTPERVAALRAYLPGYLKELAVVRRSSAVREEDGAPEPEFFACAEALPDALDAIDRAHAVADAFERKAMELSGASNLLVGLLFEIAGRELRDALEAEN
jgi:hypothetical protein